MAINDDNPLDFSSFGTPVDDGATPFDNFATPQPVAAKPRSTYGFNPDIESAIDDAAGTHGVDPDLMRTFARIESGGDPRKRTGSYNGLFMLSADEFKRFGGDADIFDPGANARAAALKFKSEEADFEKNYGRKPSASELYFLHQQGVGGADAHWRNPEAPAWENMYRTAEGRQKGPAWAKQAIWGNLPDSEKRRFGSVENITSRDFTDFWDRRVRDLSGQNKPVQVAQAPRQTMTDALDFSQFGTPVSEKPLDFTKQAAKPESDDRWEISKGFVGGFIGGNPKNFGDALVGFGHVFERPELLSRGDDIAKWGKDKLENYKARIPSFTDIRTDGVLNFLSDLGSYAGYQTGQAVASSLPSLATGAILGGTLRNPTAARVGWWAGASVPSFIQNYGDVYGSVREDEGIQKRIKAGEITEREAATWSMMAGGAMAALDTWGLEKVLGGAFKEAKADLKRRILAGMVKGAATEGPTEAMQEVISQWAQYWLGSEKTLKQAAIEVVDNFFGGVFGGGAIGGATSAIQKPAAKAEPAPDGGRVELDAAKGKVSPSAPRTTPPPLPEEGPEMSLPDVPGKPATETPPPSPEEMSVLRRMGYTEVDIRDMEPEQRAAEMEDAKSRGIVPDVPSAEPIQDIVAQARDLADPENDRRGLYLSPDNVRQIQENPDFIEQIGAALRNQGELVQNVDGNGGILLTKDAATADAVRTAIQGGQDLQQVLGEVTGAGQGKPADATAVVQQVTPEGAVTRESAVTQDQVAPTLDAFKADGRGVRAVTPEEALARREQGRTTPPPLPTEQLGDGSRQAPVRVETPEDIARAEQRVVEPTDGQKEAGNYSKGHLKFQGLDITIENPKGSIRRGTSPDGAPWEVAMPTTYGYLKRSVGRDGDQVDVYVGPNPKSDRVFIIDQVDPDTGKFDEHKAMIGYNTISAARFDYEQAFSDGRAAERMGGVTEMTVAKFKDWLAKGKRTRPVSKLDEEPDAVAEQPTETPQEQADKLPDNLTDAERETLVKAWRYVNAIEQARAQGRDIQQQRLDIANELDADLASYGIEFDSFPDERSLREYLGSSRGTDQAGNAVTEAPQAAEAETSVAEGSGRPGSPQAEVVQRDQADGRREGDGAGQRNAQVERPKRYEGDNLTDDDIDTIVDQWKYVREVANRPKPESLAAFVIARGGIKDDAREVRQIAGAAKERPGLINKDGWALDDIALASWESGFMGDMAERPTIADFLDRLQDDLHTGTVVRLNDEPLLDDIRIANEIARELADYGVTTNRFRSEATLREYFGQERPAVTGKAARDEEAEPAAEERTGQARPDQDEVILPHDEAPETGPSDSRAADYEALKSRRDRLEAEAKSASDALNSFPKGPMGLTPDDVKASPEFRAARQRYQTVADELRKINQTIAKNFAKESRADRDAARAAGVKQSFTTEASGQTSLVPEATTKEKIAAEAKKKGDRGKANADLDAGELFNPDAGKQTDLVDMAKAAVVVEGVTATDAASETLAKLSLADLVDLEKRFQAANFDRSLLPDGVKPMDLANEIATRRMRGEEPKPADPYTTGKDVARDHVLTNGRKTGTEYGMVVMADGSTKPVTPSERNSKSYLEVSAKTAPDLYDGPAKSADLHHNHPKSSSFSRADYTEAAVRPALRRTWVHGHDGSEYWASFKTNDPVVLGKAYDIAMAVTERLTEKGYDLPRYRTHMIATMMRDGGVIEYGATLTPARADERIATLRKKFGEDAIAKAVEDIRNLLGGQDVYDRRPGSVRFDRDVGSASARVDEARPEAPGSEAVGERGQAQDRGNESGQVDPLIAIGDKILDEGFKTIVEARKFARDLGIEGDNKAIDEIIETAVVGTASRLAQNLATPPKNVYRMLVNLYNNQPNLGSRTGTSVANQAYSTPVPLAYLASRLAGVASSDSVYEPTAGNGALLLEVVAKGKAVVNELDPRRAASLRAQGFTVTENDGAIPPKAKDIDSVIMNPPFGAVKAGGKSTVFKAGDWSTTQIDHAVAINGLEAMASDGKAVLILGGTKSEDVKERRKDYRGKAKREFYYRLYNQYNVVDHFTVSGDLYSKQGASWPVDVIVIDGRGKSERELPAANPPAILKSWDQLAEKLPDAAGREELASRPVDKPSRGTPERGTETARDDAGAQPATDRGESEPAQPRTEGKPGAVRADRDQGQPADVGSRERPDASQSRSDRDGRRTGDQADSKPIRPRVKRERKEGASQAAYEPASNAKSLDTLIPVNMADAARNAIERVAERHGSIDTYVAEQLGYKPGSNEFAAAFSAEQVDALASAIDNVERGAAFIIGDQTGIGKGRIAAGMLRYAMQKGMVPVFVTEKPDLYGDMFRDLRDIGVPEMLGRDVRMFITNSGETVALDEEAVDWKNEYEVAKANGEPLPKRRGQFLVGGTAAKVANGMARIANGEDVADVVFTTYDQMNTVKGQTTARRQFLAQVAPGAMIVFDESHNAGGAAKTGWEKKDATPNRADFARELAAKAKGVMFSSATYAKRPDVMDLYARTDMGKAVDDAKELPELIQRGGVPMQQIVASMLSESGQYMRRERSFDGVEYALEPVPVDHKAYKQFSASMQAIFRFDLAVEEFRKEWGNDALDSRGMAKAKDSGVGGGSANSTSFGALMHNITNQMLLAIKAEQTAQRAIKAHKAGEKPVIALANTNESFIKDFAENEGIEIGQTLDLDFSAVLDRYLKRTLRVTLTHPDGKKKEHLQIPIDDLPTSLRQEFRAAQNLVREGDYQSLPISPIDWIRHRLGEAGMSVKEVTGRQTMIDYSQPAPKYIQRPKAEQGASGKRGSIAYFNSGRLDALILNRSGSTGVSMHASEKFKDRRRRRMILAQAEGNIDTHLQMLGRVHRTGQVIPPAYSQIAAEIPAEARPTAVLMKKMASLNANTTGARSSAFTVESVDFINEVGDKVVADLLIEDADLNDMLGSPLMFDEKGAPKTEDVARKATGRLVLLDPDVQARFLDQVQKAYQAEVEQLDALGENPLEAKTVDIQAKTLDTTELKPKQGDSPFLDAVRIEKVSAKAQGRAMPPTEVAAKVAESIKGTKPDTAIPAALASLETQGRMWADKERGRVTGLMREQIRTEVAETGPDAKESTRRRLEAQLERWNATMTIAYPGARVVLGMPAGDLNGIVMSVERTGKAKQMTALGSWTIKIAVPDSMRVLEFPMSKLFPPSAPKSEDEKGATIARAGISHADLVEQFEAARKEGRETRYVVTGNILGGYDQTRGRGRIVNFTTDDGKIRPGILMGREFEVDKFMDNRRVRFQTGAQIATFLDRVPLTEVTSKAGEITLAVYRGEYRIEMAGSRQKAGQFFTDRDVLKALAPKDFAKRGNKMIVDGLSRAQFVRAVDKLKAIGGAFETNNNQDEAQEIIAGGMREEADQEDFPRVNKDGYILALPYEKEWGNPRFIKADWERAIARLREIQSINADEAPWADLVQAKRDIDQIVTNLFYFSPDRVATWETSDSKSSNDIWLYLHELENPEVFAADQDNQKLRRSLFSEKNIPAELADFADEGGQAIDSLLDSKRKGLSDLLKYDDEIDPVKPKKEKPVGALGDKMPSGFYFKAARKIDEARETLFQMSGQAVINWLMKEGVSRAEINHFRLWEKFGGTAKFTRDEFKQAIAERMFDFRRKMSWLNPERSKRDYELGGTRAFTGPRVPGQGIYFERPIAFPKKLAGGAQFPPGQFKSPHWYTVLQNAWASWRGSIRDVPGYGKMLVGEEGQSDYMQGASTGRRPKITEQEFLAFKEAHPKYKRVMEQAEAFLLRAIGSGSMADRGTPIWDLRIMLGNDLVPTDNGNELPRPAWDKAIELARKYVKEHRQLYLGESYAALDKLVALRTRFEEFFAPGARDKYDVDLSKRTPQSPIDENYVRVMARDLLLLAAEKNVDSISVSTSSTTARIQNNPRAAHFYDQQMKPALERELRKLTGQWDLSLQKVALPKAMGSPKSERPYTVWAAKLEPATLEKIKTEGMPLMALGLDTKQAVRNLRRGIPVSVAREVRAIMHSAIARDMPNLPDDLNVGTLKRAVPGERMPGQDDIAVGLTFERADGTEFTTALPLSFFANVRAVRIPGRLVSDGRDAVMFMRTSASQDLAETARGELWHEVVHHLRRSGRLAGDRWERLLGHAVNLRVLDTEVSTYLRMIGEPDWNVGEGTLLDSYNALYAGAADLQERINQEAVTHLVERHIHGQWSQQEVSAVSDLLDDIISGRLSGKDTATQDARSEEEIDAAIGQSMRMDLDNLGFYSKALEAARGLKQEKGTPEQMLAQLKKAGVKDAEIEATGLADLFREKAGSTTALESDAITLSQNPAAVAFDALPKEVQEDIAGWVMDNVPAVAADAKGGLEYAVQLLSGRIGPLTSKGDPLAVRLVDIPLSNLENYNRAPSDKAVATYAGMLSKSEAPPILVDGNRFIDGGHRVAAYKRAGRKTIPAVDVGPLLRMDWGKWIEGSETDASFPLLSQQQGDRTASPSRRARLNQISKAEIVKHLEENRVGLREVTYADPSRSDDLAWADVLASEATKRGGAVGEELADLAVAVRAGDITGKDFQIGVDSAGLLPETTEIVKATAKQAGISSEPARWSRHSLDPSNPTYRETVIHLPAPSDKLGLPPDTEFEAIRREADESVFRSGHFPEPNIIGHMMTSMTRHQGKPVYTIDQIQSDWGQKLRDGGVRDEAKIAELRQKRDAAREAVDAYLMGEPLDFLRRTVPHYPEKTNPGEVSANLGSIARGRVIGDPRAKLTIKVREEAATLYESQAQKAYELLDAELRTAEASSPGHPLVNTTDQWTQTTLRRAIRQAVEAGAEYIAVPTGDTVLEYNPGDTNGMRGFYGYHPKLANGQAIEGIVPKNLRKLLSGIDKASPSPVRIEQLETPSGMKGEGFTLFPLTDKVRQSVMEEGQPMFSIGAYHGSPFDFDRFSLDHIGKGEGVQAFGPGLYFTQTRSLANFYRAKLSGGSDSIVLLDGVDINQPNAATQRKFEEIDQQIQKLKDENRKYTKYADALVNEMRPDWDKAGVDSESVHAAAEGRRGKEFFPGRNINSPTSGDPAAEAGWLVSFANEMNSPTYALRASKKEVEDSKNYLKSANAALGFTKKSREENAWRVEYATQRLKFWTAVADHIERGTYNRPVNVADVAAGFDLGGDRSKQIADLEMLRETVGPFSSPALNLLTTRDLLTKDDADTLLKVARSGEFAEELTLGTDVSQADAEAAARELEDLIVSGRLEVQKSNVGFLYDVTLHVNDDELLLWDEPLSKQSERVQKALEAGGARALGARRTPLSWLKSFLFGKESKVSRFVRSDDSVGALVSDVRNQERLRRDLLAAGIPGIKYLDGSSRKAGKGTYNYVIFDADKIEITAKNGEPLSKAEKERALASFGMTRVPVLPDTGNISRGISEAIGIITRITGKDAVQIEFRDQISGTEANPAQLAAARAAGFDTRTAGGLYKKPTLDAKALISLATNDPAYDLKTAAGHEAFHHVEEVLANPAEKRLLTSDSEMARMRALASDEFGMSPNDPRLSRLPATEIRAVAFQRYRRMREEGLANASRLHIGIRRFFDRIIQIFQGVRNVLKGYGYDSYEAIFDRARTGEMADPVARRASDRPVRTLRNLIDPQMRPEGYVEREPFDLKNVRLVGRSMASVPLDAIRTIQKSVSIGSVRAKLGLPESDDGRPVSVFKYGNTYYVNDGNHRIEAMRINGAKTIRAEIIEIAPKGGNAEVLADRGSADVQAQPVGAQEDNQGAQASMSGGPALDMSKEARLARAQEMGFDTSRVWYRGAASDRPELKAVESEVKFPAVWFSASPDRASDFAFLRANEKNNINLYKGGEQARPSVLPAYARGNFKTVEYFFRGGSYERMAAQLESAKTEGYDGVIFRRINDTPGERGMSFSRAHNVLAIFDPSNIRSVNAAFDPRDADSSQLMASFARMPDSDVQASLIPAAARAYTARWLRRLQPSTDAIRVYLQDKVLPIRRQEEAIEAASGIKLPEHLSAYTAEAIYHGRAGERLTDLQEKHVEPLIQHVRQSNISFDELGDYLYARHALERNEAIRQIDPTNDAGSGMTDAEANGIVGMIEQGKRAQAFKTAAGMIDAMVKDARDTLYRAGNLTKEQYDNWTTKYKSYVPLRGFEGEVEEFGIPRVGRGMDIRGPESMQALGRRSKADNPAAYVIQQSVQAIIRSEKNRVDKTLYRLIQAHPDPDVWRVFKGEAKRRINPATGLVDMYWVPPAFAARNKDNVFGVKIAGKQHYMEILHEPLARSLRTAQPGLLGTAPGRAFYSLARFYAQLVTSFNPEFVISNYLRDIQTALMNVGDVANKPDGTRKKIVAEALSFKSIRGVMAALQSHEGRTIFGGQRAADENMLGRKRSKEAQDYAKWFEEYRLAGGKISFIEMNDIDRIKNRVEKSISEGKTRRALRNVFDLIDNANSAVENGVRLSAYIALRKNGVSQDKAAFAARELTVNFNRKGELGPGINAFYLFFNASVQGSTRLAQALTRSPAVRKGAATIILAGVLIDLLNYSIAGNDDDDENAYEKIDDWKKEKNMIVMLPGRKDYVQIPMPYGYNVLYLFGQKMAALARTAAGAGKEKPEKAIAGLLGAMVESFSPMGAAPSWSQMALPTFLDPFIQIKENENWLGRKIYPDKMPNQKYKPDSEMFFSTAPPWAIDLARSLNRLTGGSKVESGYIDVSPESIEHVAEFLGGGVSKFISNIWNTGQRAYNGQEWVPEKTPFLRRVYGKATSESRRRDFYEKWNDIAAAHWQYDDLRKAKDFDGMKAVREKHPAEIAGYEPMRAAQRQISALRKQGDVINLNRELDAVEKEKRLKLLMERENEIILRALANYNRIKKEKEGSAP